MSSFAEFIEEKELVVLDGGMGRELKRIGAPFRQPLWSAAALLEDEASVLRAHNNFINAGADIITVNSYACVPFHLGEELYQEKGEKLTKRAGYLARFAADTANKKVYVAASLPPVFGSYRADLFNESGALPILEMMYHAQNGYVDLFLAETISNIKEALLISNVLKNSDKLAYFSFTLLDEVSGNPRLRSGESVSEAIKALIENNTKNLSAISFNCSIPEVMLSAITEAKKVIDGSDKNIKIGVYANSFTPIGATHEANDKIQENREFSEEEYLEFAKAWHKAGATIIGGCCGITPSHIEAIDNWRKDEKFR